MSKFEKVLQKHSIFKLLGIMLAIMVAVLFVSGIVVSSMNNKQLDDYNSKLAAALEEANDVNANRDEEGSAGGDVGGDDGVMLYDSAADAISTAFENFYAADSFDITVTGTMVVKTMGITLNLNVNMRLFKYEDGSYAEDVVRKVASGNDYGQNKGILAIDKGDGVLYHKESTKVNGSGTNITADYSGISFEKSPSTKMICAQNFYDIQESSIKEEKYFEKFGDEYHVEVVVKPGISTMKYNNLIKDMFGSKENVKFDNTNVTAIIGSDGYVKSLNMKESYETSISDIPIFGTADGVVTTNLTYTFNSWNETPSEPFPS